MNRHHPAHHSARWLAVLAALALLVALCGCAAKSPDEPPADLPAEAAPAFALFSLARQIDPDEERLAGTVRADLLENERTELLDALRALRDQAPELVQIEEQIDPNRRTVHLSVALTDEGTSAYTVITEQGEDGAWQVVWFGGPGVEWPSPGRQRDEGLSTSPATQ